MTCTDLGLITLNSICNVSACSSNLKQYSDVFEGLGCVGEEYQIELDPAVSPLQQVPHHVPVAMKQQLKSKLDELEKQGIVTKAQEPTAWTSNIVTIMKPGKL